MNQRLRVHKNKLSVAIVLVHYVLVALLRLLLLVVFGFGLFELGGRRRPVALLLEGWQQLFRLLVLAWSYVEHRVFVEEILDFYGLIMGLLLQLLAVHRC